MFLDPIDKKAVRKFHKEDIIFKFHPVTASEPGRKRLWIYPILEVVKYLIPGFFGLFSHLMLSTEIHNVIHKEPMHFSLYFDGYKDKKRSKKSYFKGVLSVIRNLGKSRKK
jgi:hypothetical protein